jgi:hypothetical protein
MPQKHDDAMFGRVFGKSWPTAWCQANPFQAICCSNKDLQNYENDIKTLVELNVFEPVLTLYPKMALLILWVIFENFKSSKINNMSCHWFI